MSDEATTTTSSEAPAAPATTPEPAQTPAPTDSAPAEGASGEAQDSAPEGAAATDESASGEPAKAWDAELLSAAENLGWDKSDYPTEAALKKAVSAFEKQISALGKQTIGQPAAEEKPAEAEQPAPTEQPATTSPQVAAALRLKFKREVLSDEVANELDEVIGGIHSHYSKQFDEMKGIVGQLIEQRRNEQYEQFEDWFDTSLSAMAGKDAGYKDSFGTGTRHEIDPKSEPWKVRSAIHDEFFALMAGYQKMGRNVPNREQLLKKACALVMEPRMAEIERKRIASQLDKQKGRMLARPTKKREASEKGDAAAEAGVEAILKRAGL